MQGSEIFEGGGSAHYRDDLEKEVDGVSIHAGDGPAALGEAPNLRIGKEETHTRALLYTSASFDVKKFTLGVKG